MKVWVGLFYILFLIVNGIQSCKERCDTSLNVNLSGTDDSQCAYVFSIPAKVNGKCPPLKEAVKQLCDKYDSEDTLAQHLIGYYPFDRDSLDYSGNERNGAITGGLSYDSGIKGKAGKFDGSTKVVVDDFRNFNFGSKFSVSAWFQRTTTTNYQGIVNNGYYSTGGWEIRMGREFSGQMLGGGIITSDSSTAWDYINLRAAPNTWHHVVMTYDGQLLSFYLDGEKQVGDEDCCSGTILVKNTPVTIGQAGVGMNLEYFVGLIDEVKLFDISLTADQVDALYKDNNIGLPQ
ncbi:uncharacterized protein [Antedon mediterranea]|uniref:uncharacterized protein n=1 Tax=Antedon mediterranea TaxID=105859 RepID=UPI003AF653E1